MRSTKESIYVPFVIVRTMQQNILLENELVDVEVQISPFKMSTAGLLYDFSCHFIAQQM